MNASFAAKKRRARDGRQSEPDCALLPGAGHALSGSTRTAVTLAGRATGGIWMSEMINWAERLR